MLGVLNDILKKHQQEFDSVIPFEPFKDKLIPLDFSEKNVELTTAIVEDTQEFTNYINRKLRSAGARYAIGGYGEYRMVYARSSHFDAAVSGEEPRRVHLGTDIWGRPNTKVIAPMNGVVHSFAYNDNFGDYGVTIILTHLLDGKTFYTLYGHLSLNSVKNLQEGVLIRKGDVFAEFGIQMENGHWPPHLHFQVIIDLQGWKGDYPGVCKYSEKEKWLENCPDPDLILQLNQYLE